MSYKLSGWEVKVAKFRGQKYIHGPLLHRIAAELGVTGTDKQLLSKVMDIFARSPDIPMPPDVDRELSDALLVGFQTMYGEKSGKAKARLVALRPSLIGFTVAVDEAFALLRMHYPERLEELRRTDVFDRLDAPSLRKMSPQQDGPDFAIRTRAIAATAIIFVIIAELYRSRDRQNAI